MMYPDVADHNCRPTRREGAHELRKVYPDSVSDAPAAAIRSAPLRRTRLASSVDYLDFDSLLTEEQRLVNDTVSSWVDDKVLPIIEAAWEGRFP